MLSFRVLSDRMSINCSSMKKCSPATIIFSPLYNPGNTLSISSCEQRKMEFSTQARLLSLDVRVCIWRNMITRIQPFLLQVCCCNKKSQRLIAEFTKTKIRTIVIVIIILNSIVSIAKPLCSHVSDSRPTTMSATDDVDSLKSIEKLIRMHVFGISEFAALRWLFSFRKHQSGNVRIIKN